MCKEASPASTYDLDDYSSCFSIICHKLPFGEQQLAMDWAVPGSIAFYMETLGGDPMLRIAIIAAFVLGLAPLIAGPALAGDRKPSPPCKPLDKLRAEFDSKTRLTTLTPGQFHFVEGLYVGSPTTPDGLPPGDGALLATHDGAKSGIIIWTRGRLACAPISVSEKLINLIASIKTGALDGEGDEL
jgi:hypothetical protein